MHSLIGWFKQLSTQQRTGLMGAILTISVLTLILSWWVLAPSYAVLFTQLDEQDAHQIITQLESTNIPYQLSSDSREVLIDKSLIAKTRLKIMASGLNLSGRVGFELFDKNDLGMSDFSQKINYQRALQGELERTITSLDEISKARVHLVIPEHHLFSQELNPPKAAITVHLRAHITRQQVRSIQQLVSASVSHLELKNVVVVDQNGTTLSSQQEDSTLSHFNIKKNMEAYLTNKVMHLLKTIFKENTILVKVDVVLNYDELHRELIKPKSQGLVTHEKEIKHVAQDKSDKEKAKQDITLEKSYQWGSEKESFKRAKGTIERLSISVIVPQDTSKETVHQIQHIVKSTIGFNDQRGDQISVEALAPPSPALPIPLVTESYPINTAQYTPVFYGIAFLLCAGTTALLIRRRQRMRRRHDLLIELTQWLEHHE